MIKLAHIENVVIKDSYWLESDIKVLFEDEDVYFADSTELSALMKETGVFPSSSKARNAGRHGEIPKGYTEYKASKKRRLYIWNPFKMDN